MTNSLQKATFAGGCFWCMVSPFDERDGVHSVISGYTGGHTENPTYREVCSETTGHVEAVQITFDDSKITYEEIVDLFWKQIDPTDPGGQFHDRGGSYRTVIFYEDDFQKEVAERTKKELANSGIFKKPIATEIKPAKTFYAAEEEHQDYYKKNSFHYKLYRKGSGREDFIKNTWGE